MFFKISRKFKYKPSTLFVNFSLCLDKMAFSPLSGGLLSWDCIINSEEMHTHENSQFLDKKQHSSQDSKPICWLNTNDSYVKSILSIEEKLFLCQSVGVECIMLQELQELLNMKENPICYDGFEPSGRMHIAQGILKSINVNKLTKCGCICVFWIADWFAMLNNKFDGDLKKIHRVAQYFIEVWKVSGMDMSNVRFLWASEEINKNPNDYWMTVMDISRRNSISRIKRCCQIMGRTEGDDQSAAQILYPCMQCADIFYLNADICQLGMDQRKVNMLAREYADETNRKKPIILSHGMLLGLGGQEKMSKSDPNSAIFMDDEEAVVDIKIKKAFCPPKQLEGNPCVEYVQQIIFPKFNAFHVERRECDGGNMVYETITQFREAYQSGQLHPGDLKTNLSKQINMLLQPVRDHFENKEAKSLLNEIRSY